MDLVLRAAVVFFFIFLITRVVGRRELSTLEPFDLILLVVTGDLVQQGITQADTSVTGAATVIATMAALTVAVAYASWRFPKLRGVLEGEPVILVQGGSPIERNLRRERVRASEVEAQARVAQCPSLDGVEWAILETDGRISIIPKAKRD